MALTTLRKVLHNVLKAPEHLQYQLAFISSVSPPYPYPSPLTPHPQPPHSPGLIIPQELREIFSHAPTPPSSFSSPFTPSNRKPISGDCPICFTEFAPTAEEIVWCRAACGNNIHKDCFEQWARTRARGVEVTCVYCRTPWQKGDEESVRMVKGKGKVNEEGYVNVGGELGLSGERDYSTYHPYWVRRQFGEYY